MDNRDEIINSIIKRNDIRAQKWEYRVILDALQDIGKATVSEIQNSITSEYGCELLTYSVVRYNLQALTDSNIISYLIPSKKYRINKEYIINKVKYLPISHYCVGIFSVSVILLITSIYYNYMTVTAITLVVVGSLYLLGQLLGNEFNFTKHH